MQDKMLVGRWNVETSGPRGLEIFNYDAQNGNVVKIDEWDKDLSVGCLYTQPGSNYVYIANEYDGIRGQVGGGSYLFSAKVDPDSDSVCMINEQLSLGSNPAFLWKDKSGKYLLVAHHAFRGHITRIVRTPGGFTTETVFDDAPLVLFRINDDGTIGEACDMFMTKGEGPASTYNKLSRLHFVMADPSGEIYLVTDPGLDRIYTFRIDRKNGKLVFLSQAQQEEYSAPRYVAFHPTLPLFYVNNERNATINIYRYDKVTGGMERIRQQSMLLPGTDGPASPSDVRISADGKYLYCAIRMQDIIAVYEIAGDGSLTLIQNASCGGEGPRGICFDPNEKFMFVANLDSDNVARLSVGKDGRLESAGDIKVTRPGCIAFVSN